MLSMVVEPITAMPFSIMPGPEWFFLPQTRPFRLARMAGVGAQR
jgi:hypothetical protein